MVLEQGKDVVVIKDHSIIVMVQNIQDNLEINQILNLNVQVIQ